MDNPINSVPKKSDKLHVVKRRGRKTAMMKRQEEQSKHDVPASTDDELVFDYSVDIIDDFEKEHSIDVSCPNYINLINYDHLKLLKYRGRTDYSASLIELLSILKIELKFLKEKGINLLTQYVHYDTTQAVNM